MNLTDLPLARIELDKIVFSEKNRKATNLEELADSLREHGLLQPVLLQQSGKQYLCVAGERRIRAAIAIGWEEIPARIIADTVHMDEVDALRMVENLQRENLTPWEEAQQLAGLQRTRTHYPVEQLAATVGRSPSYIAQRLSLQRLLPELRDYVLKEEYPLNQVLLLARVPEGQQLELLELLKEEFSQDWQTLADLQEILDQFNHDLAKAPWSKADAKLVPAAGPCNTCPSRSSQQGLLFPELKAKDDRCLNVKCWESKQAAFIQVGLDKMRAEQPKKAPVVLTYNPLTPEQAEQLGTVQTMKPHDVRDVKKTEKGAVQAIDLRTGQRSWVKPYDYVSSNKAKPIDQETGKPKPKTTAQKLKTLTAKRICTAVDFWRNESLNSLPRPGAHRLISLAAQFGTTDKAETLWRANDWKEHQELIKTEEGLGITTIPACDKLWAKILPVLQQRTVRHGPQEDTAENLWAECQAQAEALEAVGSLKACWESALEEIKFPVGLARDSVKDPHQANNPPSTKPKKGKKS